MSEAPPTGAFLVVDTLRPGRYALLMNRYQRHAKREVTRSYWTPEAVRARKEAKEQRRANTLAREAEKQAAIEYNAVPFHNDEEELAYLIKQQETDMKYGDRQRWSKELPLDNYDVVL